MILIGVIFFWVNYIEVSSNEYVVFNEKDERLNAIVIAKGDLIRVRFPDIENSTFITIVKKIKYIGVNTILPKELLKNIFFFNSRAKHIGYADGIKK